MQLSKFVPNQIKIKICLLQRADYLTPSEINFCFRLRIKENSSQSFPGIPTLWWVACAGFRSEEQDYVVRPEEDAGKAHNVADHFVR